MHWAVLRAASCFAIDDDAANRLQNKSIGSVAKRKATSSGAKRLVSPAPKGISSPMMTLPDRALAAARSDIRKRKRYVDRHAVATPASWEGRDDVICVQRIVIDIGPDLQRDLEDWLARHPDQERQLDRLTEQLLTQWLAEQHVREQTEQNERDIHIGSD